MYTGFVEPVFYVLRVFDVDETSGTGLAWLVDRKNSGIGRSINYATPTEHQGMKGYTATFTDEGQDVDAWMVQRGTRVYSVEWSQSAVPEVVEQIKASLTFTP